MHLTNGVHYSLYFYIHLCIFIHLNPATLVLCLIFYFSLLCISDLFLLILFAEIDWFTVVPHLFRYFNSVFVSNFYFSPLFYLPWCHFFFIFHQMLLFHCVFFSITFIVCGTFAILFCFRLYPHCLFFEHPTSVFVWLFVFSLFFHIKKRGDANSCLHISVLIFQCNKLIN